MTANPLANIPLFSELPLEELDNLVSTLETIRLTRGAILFHEGDQGDHLYVVMEGCLEVLKAINTAEEMSFNILHVGEYLGEMGLIMPGGHRTASVRAREDSTLLVMNRAQFMDLLRLHPTLANSMVSVLSQRLNASNTQTFHDLTEKNRELQQAYDELKAAQAQLIEKERMEREIQLAADIQLSILPDLLPVVDGYDFGARILAARQVGGDFYDVFSHSNSRMGALIGDVADKGIPSALFMARAHALIMAEADKGVNPGDVMRRVNRHVTRLQKSTQFVTVLYGILDVKTGEFSYARAGHELPLLLKCDGSVERLPLKPGMSIGLWEDITLDEYSISLPENSTLLFFTDGMTDCRSPEGVPFGMERIKQTLSECSQLNAQETCDYLLNKLMEYQDGAKQDDDVTLVAIHASRPPQPPAPTRKKQPAKKK